MGTIVHIPPGGPQFVIPAIGDSGWGGNTGVSGALIALAALAFPQAGGTLTLTGDVNFGDTNGLIAAYFKSGSNNIATAGFLRLANTDTIDWRNFANTGNLPFGVNSSDQLTFNGLPLFNSSNVFGGTGIGVSVIGGILTISNTGVTSLIAGTAISVSSATGDVTVTNTGVTSAIAGTGISVSSATGNITFGNTASVALADGSTTPIYAISGSPVTPSGTLTFTLTTQTANKIFAGPTSGGAAQPTFRSLVVADEVAAGNSTDIQFNTGGKFDASDDFTWSNSTKTLTLDALTIGTTGNIVGGSLTLGGSSNGNASSLLVAGGNMTGGQTGASNAGSVIIQGGNVPSGNATVGSAELKSGDIAGLGVYSTIIATAPLNLAPSSATAGGIAITAGGGVNNFIGGSVTITAGNGLGENNGNISLVGSGTSGMGTTAGTISLTTQQTVAGAGNISLTAGACSGTSNTAGTINLTVNSSTGSSLNGGPINLSAGSISSTGTAGAVNITAGSSGVALGGSHGGNVNITSGNGTLAGNVVITATQTTSGVGGATSGVINLVTASALQLNGASGSTGQVISSNGSTSAPTWVGTQQSGWGSPTNAAVISNFNGSTATLAQAIQVIAELITILKTYGILAS